MDWTQLQLREDPRSTPGFYGPWSFKILKSWSLIRSKMANFWQLWQSKSSFPSISNDILDLQYLIRYYLPIHKMHCMWMYCKSKVKVFWARLCNLLEKDWQHSRLDTWLGYHTILFVFVSSCHLSDTVRTRLEAFSQGTAKNQDHQISFTSVLVFVFCLKNIWQIPFRGLWPLTLYDIQRS